MPVFDGIARAFAMDDLSWRRHANPWSVWTRLAAVPAAAAAVWSRAWIGWWAVIPVALVIGWLFANTKVFRPVGPGSWAADGIYGEQWWLQQRHRVPSRHRTVLRCLIVLGLASAALMAYGLVVLQVWPTVTGAAGLVLAQLWRIDRMGLHHRQSQPSPPEAAGTAT
ncbi:MAG: DUF6653 family protein [Propionibacteriaceae bacterium]